MFRMGYKTWHGHDTMRFKYDSITMTFALSIWLVNVGYGTPVLPKDPKRGLKKATPKLRASAMTNTGMFQCFFFLACQWVFFHLLIHLVIVYLFEFMCLFICLYVHFLAFGAFDISSPFRSHFFAVPVAQRKETPRARLKVMEKSRPGS